MFLSSDKSFSWNALGTRFYINTKGTHRSSNNYAVQKGTRIQRQNQNEKEQAKCSWNTYETLFLLSSAH